MYIQLLKTLNYNTILRTKYKCMIYKYVYET